MDGSLATSNILDLIKTKANPTEKSDDQELPIPPPLHNNASSTPVRLPHLSSSALYGRPSIPIKKVGLFGEMARPAKSTY